MGDTDRLFVSAVGERLQMKALSSSKVNSIRVCPLNSRRSENYDECEACPADSPVFYSEGEEYAECLTCEKVSQFAQGSEAHILTAFQAACKDFDKKVEEEKPRPEPEPEVIEEPIEEEPEEKDTISDTEVVDIVEIEEPGKVEEPEEVTLEPVEEGGDS